MLASIEDLTTRFTLCLRSVSHDWLYAMCISSNWLQLRPAACCWLELFMRAACNLLSHDRLHAGREALCWLLR